MTETKRAEVVKMNRSNMSDEFGGVYQILKEKGLPHYLIRYLQDFIPVDIVRIDTKDIYYEATMMNATSRFKRDLKDPGWLSYSHYMGMGYDQIDDSDKEVIKSHKHIFDIDRLIHESEHDDDKTEDIYFWYSFIVDSDDDYLSVEFSIKYNEKFGNNPYEVDYEIERCNYCRHDNSECKECEEEFNSKIGKELGIDIKSMLDKTDF